MRVPHHLVKTPAGFSFRQRVPVDLQPLLGCRILKRSLRTREMRNAQACALILAARYAEVFSAIRKNGMGEKTAEQWLQELRGQRLQDYTLERDANGTLRIQAEPGEDTEALTRAIESIGRVNPAFFGTAAAPAAPSKPQPSKILSLMEARDLWLKAIAPDTIPKTYSIKKSAIDGFVRTTGPDYPLPSINRIDLSNFYQSLADAGISTPTRVNKQSYLGGFFDWLIAAGYYTDSNPARSHVSYGNSAKRKRRKLGFKAFDLKQISLLFAPSAFATLSPAARWAALLGLYTGARASEVGQLLVSDVQTEGGVAYIHINDDGEHQRLKSEASIRTVPIHADLMALGFGDHVASLPTSSRLFPQAKANAVNGAGNWISKAFTRHLAEHGKTWPKAKRGFHSLRKTVIQQMQGFGVASEMRAQIVGHELDDEHHPVYSREFTPAEKLNGLITPEFKTAGLSSLSFNLELAALKKLLG
ncbi:tyrosine-type recombinase/integrase [Stenotrophomonas maltophilia]|uniref:DUF6538 domain-containing protein n=1 Tax=Stenotrophomonas maltophilia TaxID=40324 RepID=UPI0021C6A4A2|nr:DUF6538 domain-containing protein [Stenotrophomonas maltophilia]MCU1188746.1 tyrosine-type recombinase/integrase [Stenotrophomonas maltophilia]